MLYALNRQLLLIDHKNKRFFIGKDRCTYTIYTLSTLNFTDRIIILYIIVSVRVNAVNDIKHRTALENSYAHASITIDLDSAHGFSNRDLTRRFHYIRKVSGPHI